MRKITADFQPHYNIYFETTDINGALACLVEYGYCVIRKVIDPDMIEALKDDIDAALDPDRNLPPASNRYHMMFAEASMNMWNLIEHPPFLEYVHKVHGTTDVCLHRSAAILRTPGDGMGSWHTDHRGHFENPKNANEILNRYPIPSGSWFYLCGSHPDRSGIAVIEKSNKLGWPGPEGFELKPDRTGFHPVGETQRAGYNSMEVPGCIGVVADPGDLICFAALTYHANMATNERRYSCGFGFRPKFIRINAPWPLPDTAEAMVDALPDRLKHLTEGYTGYDGNWQAESD